MNTIDRRAFLAASAASLPALSSLVMAQQGGSPASGPAAASPVPPGGARRPVAIASGNGLRVVQRAIELLRGGHDPLEAVVAGVNIIEDDPDDQSVGFGGLPNENGVVELDASVMHGPSHKAGAVAALQNVKNPSLVALQVLRRTDHVLLVGAGALEFARKCGFQEENLLTEKSREAWLKWRGNLNKGDKWLDDDQQINLGEPHGAGNGNGQRARGSSPMACSPLPIPHLPLQFTNGTVHGAAVNGSGDIGACTSTSGLSWKLAGRVGDSPIIGAGLFVDNEVGSAGATGRGEAAMQSSAAFQVVRHMADGANPTEACLKVLRWVADHTRQKYLLDDKGRPNFDLVMYALRKDGAYGAACMRRGKRGDWGKQFAVADAAGARLEDCAPLLD